MPVDNIFPFTFPVVVLLDCCFFLHRAIVLLYKISSQNTRRRVRGCNKNLVLTWLDWTGLAVTSVSLPSTSAHLQLFSCLSCLQIVTSATTRDVPHPTHPLTPFKFQHHSLYILCNNLISCTVNCTVLQWTITRQWAGKLMIQIF